MDKIEETDQKVVALSEAVDVHENEILGLKNQLEEQNSEVKYRLVEQEHRLINSSIQLFKSFFFKDQAGLKSAAVSAFIGNIWRMSRGSALIASGGLLEYLQSYLCIMQTKLLSSKTIIYECRTIRSM